MLMLNYASEELKKEAKNRRIYHVLKKNSYFLVSLVFLTSAIMFSSEFLLNKELERSEIEKAAMSGVFSAQNKELKEINNKIRTAEEIGRNALSASKYLDKIAGDKKTGIKFTLLNFDLTNNQLAVNAEAADRDALLAYKEALQNNKAYQALKFITPNLTEKTNIKFNFEAKYKPE